MMQSNEEWFVEMSEPHAWLLTADNLHEQAVLLYEQRGRSRLTRTFGDEHPQTWDAVDRSVFLLGGFALENAIKAFLVYEHPEWISNGRLAKPLRSHSLVDLRRQSTTIPYRDRYTWVLRDFEEGLESWARYPCGLTADTTDEQNIVSEPLWRAYLRLMRAYGKRLTRLIGSGWKGPHGWNGRWHITGEFLSMAPGRRACERAAIYRV
jgi:hypothetical protein